MLADRKRFPHLLPLRGARRPLAGASPFTGRGTLARSPTSSLLVRALLYVVTMKQLFLPRVALFVLCGFVAAGMTLVDSPAAAQATTGQISGRVTDPSGAVVPGAAVRITDENKGVTFAGRSDATGNFTIVSLPPGIYSVNTSAPGFSSTRYDHVVLAIDQRLALNFSLKLGSVASVVTVTDTVPLLQTQSAEVGTVISGNAITDLPL
jgi:Carboxypeptidase regulatory-like domain